MLILVIGGSGSGKSEYAESCCMQLASSKKTYIATMKPYDEESVARIARHQKMRAGKGFETVECYTHLEEAVIPGNGTVLLECMSNLVANEMFSNADGNDPAPSCSDMVKHILNGIDKLKRQSKHVIVVTNQVFSDGMSYDKDTDEFMRVLAQINRRIALEADEVCEVICGVPVYLKQNSKE